ncbi:glycosyltransferase family 4 protein [Psychroserpens luteus]|uniref:Glycosyltransferase family 4 protein n=1 Tax=Psychroserpens luteus TaxID=1434066 RepID=A0ABW5ZY30_9FLAO|nr:glycosyltransferase family 4 protein [Psychroserpens luteus]
MKKLAIVSTHPIQYNAPWFKLLAQRQNIDIKVFYTWSQAATTVEDKTFGKQIEWDIPLLEGYNYEFVENTAKKPGVHHFLGINCPELVNSIKAYKPDTVLVFGWNFKSHLKTLRYFKGKIPVWFRGDSTLLDEVPGVKTKLRRLVLSWIYKHVDTALFVGDANKAYFLKHGLKEEQLAYVPHAIDNERFNDNESNQYEQKAAQWRTDLGFFNKDIVVLFAGKFESKKQPEFLMNAIIEANKNSKKSLKLVMVGDGPLVKELKQQASTYDFITFVPFQNQTKMPIVYRLGNVFCLPSKGPGETWGLAVNEASSCTRPVIVSDKVGCAEDILNKGKNGWVFRHDNENELIKILESLTQERLQIAGRNAEQSIKSWSFEAIVSNIESQLTDGK